jgi:hypothetical protein
MSSVPGFRRPSAGLLLGVALLLTAAACGPDPTPLPVLPIATTPAPDATRPADLLPTVAIDALTLSLLPAVDRARLNEAADVRAVPGVAEAGAGPLLSIQPFEGGTLTAYGLNVVAQLDVTGPPLNDPALATALTAFLSDRLVDPLRLALANAGFPDGLTLTVEADPALLPLALNGLEGAPIRWALDPDGGRANVTLMAGAEADAQIGQGGLLIGTLPLYARGWQIGRGDDGLPLFMPGT